MSQQQSEVIWQEDTHACRIISIEDLFQVDHIFYFELARHIELRLKVFKVLSFESDSEHLLVSLRSSLVFIRSEPELLCSLLLRCPIVYEGSSPLFLFRVHVMIMNESNTKNKN